MLSGVFRHIIDQKNRLFIPARHRDELGDRFILVMLPEQPCLRLYSAERWDAYQQRLDKLPEDEKEDVFRFIYNNLMEVLPDSQGRILVPANLKAMGGLEKDVVVGGARDYDEIWDGAAYDAKVGATSFEGFRKKLAEANKQS